MESDESWMRRALDLAIAGRGRVEPNPMVGCVIVKDGRMIGQGFHERFGEAHAERNALASCTESPTGATAYVTLEPCCHTNKKTPPCVPALIAAKIGRVVGACADPNPAVSGRGFEQLRQAGIAVTTDVCQAEAMQLNAAFFARTLHHRPYITLKWAQSADGLIAGSDGRTVRISNPTSTAQIHALRSRCDAILVGINTVLHDDPLLTARGIAEARPLRRLVLDTQLRLPLASRLVQSAGDHELWVFCGQEAANSSVASELRTAGVRVIACGLHTERQIALRDVLSACSDVTHLLVEPGPRVLRSFVNAGIVDRIWRIRSSRKIDEENAPRAGIHLWRWRRIANADLDGDELIEYLNPQSEVYFSAVPSADFRLIPS
jgi:diaminohydroxyphosphoribosylaminopyrimidine deaminase/5-amino-6-(5-phosphoribosylamino)uracil reductase